MPNNCYFEMKIAGPAPAVEEFINMIKWQGPYKCAGLGRVFSFDIDPTLTEKDPLGGDRVAVQGQGDCAYSIFSSMRRGWRRHLLNLEDATDKLGLVIEAFSSEPGNQFQEHVLIDKGGVVIADCVSYEEYCIEDMNEQQRNDFCAKHNLTPEQLKAVTNVNGDYCIGGFEDFGMFDDLFSYFDPEIKPSLEEQIDSATNRLEESRNSSAGNAVSRDAGIDK